MPTFVTIGAAVAIGAMIAGYLIGYSHGRAEGQAMWESVFRELRDFDACESRRD